MSLAESETSETRGGNTNLPPRSEKTNQLMHWFFTWNNYESSDCEMLDTFFKGIASKFCFQEETGENGTKHLQGVISLKRRARWTEFGLPRAIHWEKVEHLTKAYQYCSKRETRTGKVFAFNFELPYSEEISHLYNWQKSLIKLVEKTPDNRTINWIWERNGCAGKTTFQKYLFTHFPDVVVLSGKGADMKNGIVEFHKKTGQLPKIIIINIPRSVDQQFISFQGIEEVKDMFFFSPKYEGGMICGASPHVLIFSNERPNLDELSNDRWNIIDINR